MLLLLACAQPPAEARRPPRVRDPDDPVETVPAVEEPVDDERVVFADTGVLEIAIELEGMAIAELERAPTAYVEGALVFRGERYAPVGVRLKGSSTYQCTSGSTASPPGR